jgi:hypothetical protein
VNESGYQRLDLPIAAVEQGVRDLVAGGGPLSDEILRQWSAAMIWTGAMPGARPEDLIEVARGGLPTPARQNPAIITFIRQFLAARRDRLALFEDAVARPGDPALRQSESAYVVVDDHVLPMLLGGDVDDAKVRSVLTDAWSWRLVGLLTGAQVESADHDLGMGLADLVAQSRHIVVGAWDGEGLLVVDRV